MGKQFSILPSLPPFMNGSGPPVVAPAEIGDIGAKWRSSAGRTSTPAFAIPRASTAHPPTLNLKRIAAIKAGRRLPEACRSTGGPASHWRAMAAIARQPASVYIPPLSGGLGPDACGDGRLAQR